MIDRFVIYGIPTLVIASVIFIVLSIRDIDKERNRLMAECQRAGHAEYECHAMLRECGSTMVPIIVPVVR